MGNVESRTAAALIACAACCFVALFAAGCSSSAPEEASTTNQFQAVQQAPVNDVGVDSAATDDSDDRNSALQADFDALASSSHGSVSIVYAPISGSAGAQVAATDSHVSASMIKLAILGAFLQQVDKGVYALDATVEVSSDDIVGGTGTIQSMGAGSYTWSQLATYMISTSDNTAANVIIDAIGMDAVNSYAANEGLSATRLNRKMMDSTAMSAGVENYMSAQDAASLLLSIAQGTFASSSSCDLAVSALSQQSDTLGIVQGVPSGVVVAHKTGTLDSARHDGGIVYASQPYVLVVMTEGMDVDEANSVIAQASIDAWTAN